MKRINSGFSARGDLEIRLIEDDKVVQTYFHKNMIVTVGKQFLVKRLFSDVLTQTILTGVSGNGTIATATFANTTTVKYPVGKEITISGVSPVELNGDYVVLASTYTTVAFDSTYIGSSTVHGKINGLDNSPISIMKVGTSQTQPQSSDTGLLSELGSSTTLTTQLDFTDQQSIVYIGIYGAGVATGTIAEAGLFNADGVMMCRSTFPPVVKDSLQTMQILWRVSIS